MFTRYIALGDSVSIDLYPALDAGDIDVAVALERTVSAGHVAPIGAASLLYQNSEAHWPDFVGEDLTSLSVEELGRRIALLKEEIGRLEAEIATKSAHRSAADRFFRSG